MTDPLAQLRDIHEPDAIGWWPLAPGWYIVILIVIFIFSASVYFGYRAYQNYRQRKAMLALLAEIKNRYRQNLESAEIIAELAIFLRRLVITYYPQYHAAEWGATWLTTLDNISDSKHYTQGVGQLLISAPYQKHAPPKTIELIELITQTTEKITKRRRRIA